MTKKKKIKNQPKEKVKNKQNFDKPTLRQYVMDIFTRNVGNLYNYKQLSKRLGITDVSNKRLLVTILHELTLSEKLDEVYTGKYKLKMIASYVEGTVDLTAKGNAYVVSSELESDVFVAQAHLNKALHGDKVRVYVFARRKNQQYEGEIIEVISRQKQNFVGVIEVGRTYAFLVADDRRMPYDIFIPKEHLNGAVNGQKVVAQIEEWPNGAKNPIGKVTEVLGRPGDHNVEMHAILADFDLPNKFPAAVERAAEEITDGITAEEIAARRDFRQITTLTIDPEDAKDFDDALSLRKLPNGNYEVGVHIADVSFYVPEGSELDKEAYSRATSVYLVDRVVPMLPERLSNFICSLRPNEDKLTYSAVFELDEAATVVNSWFGRTVINSDRRFTYAEAQDCIETGTGDYADDILTLHRLAQELRRIRFDNNALNFERDEVKFRLDENGKPIEVYFKEMQDSNHLIEEFMLLANKKVAELIGNPQGGAKGRTFVYRIHDHPSDDKMKQFADFVRRFGYTVNIGSPRQTAKSLNKLLTKVQGKGEQDMIEQLAIRSMAKAIYTTFNIGHYGLSFDHYTHFTSPIRRYPDVLVHRLIDHYMQGGKSVDAKHYEEMCEHSSDRENKAAQAERASVKYKQVEFMQDKLGSVFEGMVSGVTDWGLYVEIVENKIEGMIALRDIEDDYYAFDEKNFRIIGQRSKKVYQLGDKIKVQIIRANLERKQIDFMFA